MMEKHRYETDADRAKKVLRLKKINLKQINRNTGIPYNTLKGYSRNLDTLNTASWSNVHKLSLYYQRLITNGLTALDYIETQDYINQIFSDFQKHKESTKVTENSSKTYKNVISKIEEIIDDPTYIYEIYRVIQQSRKQDEQD